jgi:hypothetical protein
VTASRAPRLVLIAVFAAIALAAIAPVRNYDFFWHLATGRWIVEHRALPDVDPFAIASDTHPWINGEWLFQVLAYAVGVTGGSFARALLAALIFTLVILSREDGEGSRPTQPSGSARPLGVFTPQGDRIILAAAAFAGAMQTFDWRPSSVAMLFVVLAISARTWIAHAVIAAFWINIHPSALLAPAIAAMSTRRAAPVIASAVALLVNPYGWRALYAPLELMSYVRSGAFVNAEWLPSRLAHFPILYLCVLGGVIAIIVKRPEWWRVVLFAGFAYLAIRHVRNQPLFFAAFPLLMPRFEIRKSIAWTGAALAVLFVALTTDHRIGVAPERFPVRAVAALKDLKGNIYNPDQFGGFLIWSVYPERRVLTDGRNELYRAFIPEYARARGDQRAWRALLRRYEIDLAVDEYRPPLEVVDAATRRTRLMPASLAYWPRSEWALIGYDEAGMVFARRAAFENLQEIRGVVPDAR